ncbi:MAG TPA: hypothetical protein VGM54_03500 [Chthoniobacter sp.]
MALIFRSKAAAFDADHALYLAPASELVYPKPNLNADVATVLGLESANNVAVTLRDVAFYIAELALNNPCAGMFANLGGASTPRTTFQRPMTGRA